MKLRYIGPREPFFDRLHHTHQMWEVRGDVRDVDDERGRVMILCHPDLFEEAKPQIEAKHHEHVIPLSAQKGIAQTAPFEGVKIERRSGKKAPVSECTRADLLGHMDKLGLITLSTMTKQDCYSALEEYYRLHGSLDLPSSEEPVEEPEPADGPVSTNRAVMPHEPLVWMQRQKAGGGKPVNPSDLQSDKTSAAEAAEQPPPPPPPPPVPESAIAEGDDGNMF